jgi:hypothetical protein
MRTRLRSAVPAGSLSRPSAVIRAYSPTTSVVSGWEFYAARVYSNFVFVRCLLKLYLGVVVFVCYEAMEGG